MKMIRYILFDLDNTLYPASSSLGTHFEESINDYVARLLAVSPAEALRLRREEARPYGTTLRWLIEVHDFDRIDDYMAAVHPVDIAGYLEPNPGLGSILRSIPVPRSILTNSPAEHALRVLDFFGIADAFEHVFDLRYNSFVGKPDKSVYTRILDAVGHTPEETLFIDDVPGYLEPFREIGGHTLLIDELKRHTDGDHPVLESIEGLPAWLEAEFALSGEDAR